MKVKTFETTKKLILSTPLPYETRSYKPVSHKQVIDTVLEGIDKTGLQVDKETYSSSMDGNIALGRYTIKDYGDNEMQQQFVWQNSYNKMKPLLFSHGANVIVCTNGLITYKGISFFSRKHTGDILELAPARICQKIEQSVEVFKTLQDNREEMKRREVSKRLASELLGRLYFEEKILQSTSLNIIKRELENPSHSYSSPGSMWELYQFVTFAIGAINPVNWIDRHVKTHEFFCSYMAE